MTRDRSPLIRPQISPNTQSRGIPTLLQPEACIHPRFSALDLKVDTQINIKCTVTYKMLMYKTVIVTILLKIYSLSVEREYKYKIDISPSAFSIVDWKTEAKHV